MHLKLGEMSLVIHCERDCCFQNTLVCIYRCSKKDKKKCREYLKHLEEIMAEGVAEKYSEKYGEPDFCLPKEPKKRQPKVGTEVKPKKRIVRKLGEPEVDIPTKNKTVKSNIVSQEKVDILCKKTRNKRSDLEVNSGKANVEIEPKKKRRSRSDKGQKRGKRK